MKKLLLSLSLCFGLVTATTPKSDAAVGALISAPAVMTVGGVVALVGGVGFAVVAHRTEGAGMEGLFEYIFFGGAGLVTAGIGLVILDGDQQGELAFSRVAADSAAHSGFSAAEIATYNRELSRLNAIQQTISAEVAGNPRLNTQARWQVLGARLSPATLEIAGHNGSAFLQHVSVR